MPAKNFKHALDSNKPIVFVLSTISLQHVKKTFHRNHFCPLRWQLCSGSWWTPLSQVKGVSVCHTNRNKSVNGILLCNSRSWPFPNIWRKKRCLKINCERHWARFLLQIGDFFRISLPSTVFQSKVWDHCHLQHLLLSYRIGLCNVFLVWESNPTWWLKHHLETIIVKVYESLGHAPSYSVKIQKSLWSASWRNEYPAIAEWKKTLIFHYSVGESGKQGTSPTTLPTFFGWGPTKESIGKVHR